MKKFGLLGSIVPLLASAGMTYAQSGPAAMPVAPAPAPITTAPAMVAEPVGQSVMPWTDGGTNSSGPKFWADADYLLFWIKNGPGGPPLVTTSTPGAITTLPNAGGIGVAGTSVLYNQNQDNGPQSGIHVNTYAWLDPDNTIGINLGGFWLQQGSTNSLFASNGAAGSTPLFVPLNVLPTSPFVTPGPNALGVASPALGGSPGGAGAINITSRSNLWGAEANGMVNLIRNEGFWVNGLVGFRYMDLKEDLSMYTTTTNNPNVPGSFILFPGAGFGPGTIATQDSFSTRNQFYGGNVGAEARATFGRFFVDVTGKVALGDTHESLNVAGLTALSGTNLVTGGAVAGYYPGGVLALPTNSGHFTKDNFSYIPEAELKLGFLITENIRATVGYDFMYWSSVARPGDQINPAVDPRSIPSANAIYTPGAAFTGPVPLFKSTDFWAQGVTFGFEIAF